LRLLRSWLRICFLCRLGMLSFLGLLLRCLPCGKSLLLVFCLQSGPLFCLLQSCLADGCCLFCGMAHCGLFSRMLRGYLGGSFCCPLGLPVLLFKPTGFSYALHIDCAFGLCLLLQTSLLLFNGLLNTLARLLARLRTRLRKVTVFRAVKIGPGI
jgi:hypothetical protein